MEHATHAPAYVAKPLRLQPFRSAMLAPSRVGDPGSVRNLARPYRDVAQRLRRWIERGWATEDDSPALYLHEYTSGGMTVRGLVGVLNLSRRTSSIHETAVWPHEAVHPEQAGDLAARMEKIRLNPAPILLAHHGHPDIREVVADVTATPPEHDFADRAGQVHRLWGIRDPGQLDRVSHALSQGDCLIADGHHRYSAYLALQAQHPGTQWDLGLAMLVDQGDTPLHLGPIHRSLAGTTLTAMEAAAMRRGAIVNRHGREEALNALEQGTLILTDDDHWSSVTPAVMPHHAIVEWLHNELLDELDPAPHVSYHHDVGETLSAASANSIGVLLPSLTFTQVRDIVTSGRLLPEKATSFQPKPSLGVLMRPVASE